MTRTRFLGTGFAVPDRIVTNDELSKVMDTSDEWIRTRTGIQERRYVREGETGVDLALAATRRALEMADVPASSVDAIVYATSTPDHFAPGNGVFLQRAMGIGTIPAIDIRTQCSGFIYALSVADGWVRTGQYRRVLVVGAEVQSTGMLQSTEGRNVSVIFADGAGAALVGPTDRDDRGILAFDLHSEGAYAEKLWVDSPGSMYHPRVSTEQIEAGRQYLHDGRQGGLPPCGSPHARIGAYGARRLRPHHRRPQAAGGAPGQPPHRGDDAEERSASATTRCTTTSCSTATRPRPRSRSRWTSACGRDGCRRGT